MIRPHNTIATRTAIWLLAGSGILLVPPALALGQPVGGPQMSFVPQVESGPESAHDYNNRANLLLGRGQFNEALAACQKAIRLDPTFTWAYNNRGIAYFGKRDFDRALADYDRATQLDPAYTFPYNNRAEIWIELGLYRKAVAECSRAIELDPQYAVTIVTRGTALARLGRLREAVADLTLAYCLDPQYEEPRRERVDPDPENKYVDGTIAQWTEAIAEHPDRPQNYIKRALVYIDAYQLRPAVDDLRKAERLRRSGRK